MNYMLIPVVFFSVLSVNIVYGGSWNLGCYYGNQTALSDGVSLLLQPFSVVACGEACSREGYDYMGLHSGSRCSCYNVTTLEVLHSHGLQQILPEYCNISCSSDGDLPLPCGGEWSDELGSEFTTSPVSLYLTRGPYLISISLQADANWIVVDKPLAIEAVATLANYVNITDEWANSSKSGLEVSFMWDIGGSVQTNTDEALCKKLRSRIPYTFTQTGNHSVEVEVHNVISSVRGRIDLTVIEPEPKDLQLVLLTGEEYRPSCTPKKCDIRPGTAAVAVFSNYSTSIEASVSVGVNLTFELEYGDDESRYERRPSEEVPTCEDRNCTSVIQDHVFRETGVYNVTVTVSNQFNSIQETMTVVVVNHKLSNLSLTLQKDSLTLVTPRQSVKFLLKVDTASRQDTTMELVIGNNKTRVFTVQEFNTSTLFLSEPDRAAIAASYGMGCMLEVEVDHTFKTQGVYRPILIVYNNVSSISATSPHEITVLNKLAGPKLHAKRITGLNMPTQFDIDFDVNSQNMTIKWSIFTTTAELVHISTQIDSQSWSYTFTSPGHYILSVTASNLHGNVSTGAGVYVQVPVHGVVLKQLPKYFTTVGSTLRCGANVQKGSDVKFKWNFDDPDHSTDVITKNMSSLANHTFHKPGKYNISVTVFNDVSEEVVHFPELYIVQRKVTFVVLQSTEPTALGNGTIFLSMIDKGTDVNFDFDFGQGRQSGRGERKSSKKYLVTHFFQTAETHVVKVYAHNLVSEVESQIHVIVEEHVPEFIVKVVGNPVVNRTFVLVAMKGGDVLQRPDLIYTWHITGNEEDAGRKSRSPLITVSLPEPGLFNLSLEVGNRLEPLVGVTRSSIQVQVDADEGQVSLHHCGIAEFNQPCKFSLQGNTTGLVNLTVEYKNQLSNPSNRTVSRRGWSTVFELEGLHRVFVRGRREGANQELELSSFFVVEKAISGLQLKGPRVVALQSLTRRYVWEALLGHGSHVIYVWALGNNRSLPTTYREYAQLFIERGTYVLFLEVFNDVSRIAANLTIVAQYQIVDASIRVETVVLGVATNLSLIVEGGREFLLHVNFGDGYEPIISSENKSLNIRTEYSALPEPAIPEHHVWIPHVYSSMGEFQITVNISNRLTWKSLSEVARIEQPIGGIVLESDSSSVVPLGESVDVRVSVETGNDLTFHWTFSDRRESTVVSDDRTSNVSHTFTYDGTFQVFVSISNPYVKSPIVRNLPINFTAVQKIDDVQLLVASGAQFLQINGNWTTNDIKFAASCYICSHVTFEFDFGDGQSQSSPGMKELQSLISRDVTHRYTKVGIYMVKVTARNPLSNKTSPPQALYIQIPPQGLRLDQPRYKTRFGDDTNFTATITQGTNVTFDWKFGDDQELLDHGPFATHRYLNRGNFTVSVIARNKVLSVEKIERVFVQYLIQGVRLKVNSTLVASGETVEFTAHPYPQEFNGDYNFVGWYIWKLDQRSLTDPQTKANRTEYTYTFAGKHATHVVATVVAVNYISNATSEPVDLRILAKVSMLRMHYIGVPLINNTLTFEMSTYSGSELNYTWNFGDGSPIRSGYPQIINHTYTRPGEFEVVGYVENELSNATVKKRVFILDRICLPPEISILPHLPAQAKFTVERSKEVKLELEIKVNCTLTHSLNYTWSLFSEVTGDPVQVVGVPESVFSERTLYFPPLSLEYGNYIVNLAVRMNGTIVYSQVEIELEIVPSPLSSVISGGILRKISIQEIINIDGATSRDPDYLNSTDMSYNWTCYSLKFRSSLCFPVEFAYVLETNQSRIQFPGSFLQPNSSGQEFAFNLTVSKPGRKPHTTTQILRISDSDSAKALHIRIVCPSCLDGLVNRNQRLAMKAVCDNCDGSEDINFKWKVEVIAQNNLLDDEDDESGQKCEPVGNFRDVNSLKSPAVPNPTNPEEPITHSTTTVSPQTVKVTTKIPGLFVPKEGSSDGRPTNGRKRREGGDSNQPLPLPQPASSPSRRSRPYGRGEYGQNGDPVPNPGEVASSVLENGQFVNSPTEGNAGEGGSAGGRSGFPDVSENTNTNSRQQPQPNPQNPQSGNPPAGNPVFDGNGPKEHEPIHKLPVEKSREPYEILPEYLHTSMHSEVFVLKPNVLHKGREYIFSVEANKKGDPLIKGESWALIRVNRSPSRGICAVPNNVTSTYELEEMFQIYCKEWKDDNGSTVSRTFIRAEEANLYVYDKDMTTEMDFQLLDILNGPVSYEVSYRLSPDNRQPFNLIYGGLNTKVEFRLPAGEGPDHLVFVRIGISDIFGARTLACDISLKVLPRQISYGNETVEEQLYNEVSRNDSTLGVFISQKDYSNTRVFANYLTLSLNRLGPAPVGKTETKALRREVRHTLLSLLNTFPIRDEYELMQTLQPVVQLTKVVPELDGRCVGKAIELLGQISRQAQIIFKDRDNARADLLEYILEVSSNIMAASSIARFEGDLPDQTPFSKSKTFTNSRSGSGDNSVNGVTKAIDAALMLETRYIGEDALEWSSDYISVFANRYGTTRGPVIEMGEMSCSLPLDMSTALYKHSTSKQSAISDITRKEALTYSMDCYEAHLITFHENPFMLQSTPKPDNEVQSKVTSLKVMDCQGHEVRIANLSTENMVKIEIPQRETQMNNLERQKLRKWQMNIHQFNITEKNFNQSLHIQVDLEPVDSGRLFPITVLIRCGEPPHPDEYLSKTEFSPQQQTLPLYLPAGNFNTTGTCFLALVDSSYDSGRPRPTDVRERDYQLKTWWGQCLFWDTDNLNWSGKGCYTTANSTLNSTICLCNHLTIFASRLDLVPNDLHFTNVEDFFDLYRSPVMFAWITAVFLIYLTAVIICRRIDLHDARKGGVVYLQDNAVTDHQKYEITLETGFRKGAGTSAKISLILHGEEGMSETRELISEDNRPLFERNSRDSFIMTLPNNIGRIWKVQLWHNNSGGSPSWYLSRVIIKDLSCDKSFYFICEKWLAVEEDDGKVEAEFMSLEGKLGFQTVFWAKGTQYAIDFHLWASLLTCPSYSNFTRVQRLTVCLSLIMSYTCLNAMWYKDQTIQYRGEFGLLDLSWRSVVVGAICCAIIIPLHLFLVFLFRRSKAPGPRSLKEDSYRTGKCEHLDESMEETVQPVITSSSILDQSLLNWQNIQEWAQKQWVKRQQSEVSSSDSLKPSTPQIELTKKTETLQSASSGFGDCASQDRIQPTLEMKKFPTFKETFNQTVHKDYPEKKPQQDRHTCYLPSCCVYFAWTLSALIIIGCAVVTMLYGFRFGKAKSTMWLQSFYFSFMVCVFISQPFMILVVTLYTAIKYRNDPSIFEYHHNTNHGSAHAHHHCKTDCIFCEECEELERGVAARQRSRYLRFARPPQEKHLIDARKKIMKEKKAYAVLQDHWQFVLFFVILATMAYGKDLSSPFFVKEYMKNSFVRQGSSSFGGIQTVSDWWKWSESSLLHGLFEFSAYDRNNITSTQNINLYIVGHVHLRQLRVTSKGECRASNQPALLNKCLEPYAADKRAEKPYGPNGTWTHSVYSQYYNVRGRHAIYDSSGYVIQIAKTRSQAHQQLKDLRSFDWIDVQTRAVLVEFTIFYAPTSLFTSVSLLLETPPTGGAFPYPSVSSTYLYRYISVGDNMVLAAELFFLLLVLFSVKNVVVGMLTVKYKKYISNPWNILEVVFSLMSLAYMGCYIYRFVLVYETKNFLSSSYFEMFVDISTLANWDEILKAMVGFLLALITCKFLYLLRYKRTFSNLGNFYKRAYRELFMFSAMFVIFLLAFTSLGYAAFGVFSPNFSDFWVAMETMAGLLVGCHNFPEFEMYNMIGAKLFIFSYLLVVTATLTSYIVAVLSYQYKIYRQGEMIAMDCSDTLKFFWDRFLLWSGIKRPVPPPEPDSDLPPEFTMAEIEYQVEELLFRMNAISGSSNLPEKPPCYFTDSDVTYGVGDDFISSGDGSERLPFDEERFEQRIQKIEDNLYCQEPYLAQLIKLDSIGADILSQEREKELRSHLELEIFRRLQMQREQGLRSSDRSSSSGGSLSLPPSISTRHDPPGGSTRKPGGPFTRLLKPVARSESSLIKAYEDSLSVRADHSNLHTILAPNEYVLPDTSGEGGDGGFPEDLIREALSRDFGHTELHVPKSSRIVHKPVEKVRSDRSSGTSSTSDESQNGCRADVTTTSSEDYTHVTGAGARAKVKHGGQPKVKPEAATPSSAKVFSHSSLRDLPPIEVTRTSIIGSPGSLKRKPGALSLVNPLSRKGGRSGIVLESSSGSEQDAYRGRRPASKARTLRKTKSRGKGKGKCLPTLDSLEDDFLFENDGYNTDNMYGTSSTSESSKDKSSSSSEHKQAWI